MFSFDLLVDYVSMAGNITFDDVMAQCSLPNVEVDETVPRTLKSVNSEDLYLGEDRGRRNLLDTRALDSVNSEDLYLGEDHGKKNARGKDDPDPYRDKGMKW